VGNSISCDDVVEELDGGRAVELFDWLGLDPLGELVHSNQEMRQAPGRDLEWSYHVQAPDSKRPGERDGLEGCRWSVSMLGEALAAVALFHQLFCILLGCRPIETMAEGLGHQGSGRCVVSALPLVYLPQQLYPFFRLDALLEDS
jgi:hypothetical protein